VAQDGRKKSKVSKGALSKKRRKAKAAERAECVQDKIENKAQRHARSQAVKVSADGGGDDVSWQGERCWWFPCLVGRLGFHCCWRSFRSWSGRSPFSPPSLPSTNSKWPISAHG
jgi:hypothetical protein